METKTGWLTMEGGPLTEVGQCAQQVRCHPSMHASMQMKNHASGGPVPFSTCARLLPWLPKAATATVSHSQQIPAQATSQTSQVTRDRPKIGKDRQALPIWPQRWHPRNLLTTGIGPTCDRLSGRRDQDHSSLPREGGSGEAGDTSKVIAATARKAAGRV